MAARAFPSHCTNSIAKWVISPSTGAGTGYGSTQRIGTYPHGYVASSTQPGVNLGGIIPSATYYWQVRTVDTSLRKSAWSAIKSTLSRKTRVFSIFY